MRTIAAAGIINSLLALVFFAAPFQAHATVPCEDALKQMRAAKVSATLSDADMKKVNELEVKAVERCNADDDARADKFLGDAMTIMGK
ncbi:hypothetical protein ASC97_07935 [Rhizobium sp. Root1203]|uniref:hypothetical protein n=1 Tax=Rhizobium sp. Root1203 TaxID=1736427 RepID=UPI0007096521|nr:hypothetical protein [Rhizobium sp. Root1203]KQV28576.1 hypothetical protein ASC97_07935 [Rhizobium sp. Root1203]